jgi:hypothetical protein
MAISMSRQRRALDAGMKLDTTEVNSAELSDDT